MKIEILGPGCPKCKKLFEVTRQAASEEGVVAEITKVTDIMEMMKFGIMQTPGLALDGKVVLSGRVPSLEEVKTILRKGTPSGGNEVSSGCSCGGRCC